MDKAEQPQSLYDDVRDGHIMLRQAIDAGVAMHNMRAEAKAVLGEIGLYTTNVPRPTNFSEYRRDLKRERALDTIAERLTGLLQDVPEYKNAIRDGLLGSRLTEAFSAVTDITAHDVHVVDGSKTGTVAVSNMVFSVPTTQEARALSSALQALLHTPSRVHPIYMDLNNEQEVSTVEVGDLDEHKIRSISRAIGAAVALEYKAAGVTLPPQKRTLVEWKRRGETFPKWLEQRLEAADLAYQGLKKAATYRCRANLKPIIREHHHLLGTDSAPMLQGMRDIVNGLIWELRGGSHLNLEQDPDEAARPSIEEGIELRRDHIPDQGVYDGPPTSRTPSSWERVKDGGREFKRHPIRSITKLVKWAPLGLIDSAILALRYTRDFTRIGGQFVSDIRSWKLHKQAALDNHRRIAWYSAWHSTWDTDTHRLEK